MNRTSTVAVGVAALVAVLAAPASATDARILSVGRVIRQATTTPTGGQSDVVLQGSVAADPAHPGTALAAAEEGLQATSQGVYGVALTTAVTRDGGASWTRRPVPGVTLAGGGRWQGISWPAAAVGADGTLYAAAALRSTTCENGLGLVRSQDGGRHWSRLVVADHLTSCRQLDGRDSLTEDTGAGSPHRGRLYLGWTRFLYDSNANETAQRQFTAFSDDSGATWSAPLAMAGAHTYTQGTTVLVQPDGTVTSVFYESTDASPAIRVLAQTSHDGGATFTAPAVVTTWQFSTDGAQDLRCCQPSAAVDSVTGRLYVTLIDARFRTAGRYDDAVLFSSSDGRRWGPGVRVDAAPVDSAAEFVTPQVAAYDGDVYVSWTLFGSGNSYRQQVAVSSDAGASFGAASTLGPDGDLRFAAQAGGFGAWLGDYTGLVAVRGRAYVVWPLSTDTGRAQHQTLWAATVTSSGRASSTPSSRTAAPQTPAGSPTGRPLAGAHTP